MSSVYNPEYDMHSWLRSCEEEIIKPLKGELKGTILYVKRELFSTDARKKNLKNNFDRFLLSIIKTYNKKKMYLVVGTFPSWLQGTLLRNGPGSLKVGSDEYKHVYDGAALLHRFAIKEGQVTYQCRFLSTDTLKRNRAANRIVVTEFGTKSVPDPCHTIFDKISSFFKPLANLTDNAVISVYPFGDQVYTMTEVTNVYKIDPTTLETLEKKNLFDSLIVCQSAHPHVMPNGDVHNIGMIIKSGFVKNVIVKFPYTQKGDMFELGEVVCTMAPRWKFNPTYIHSFGITENYFVVIEQPMGISLLNILRNNLVNEAFAHYLTWYEDYETQILLVNRITKEQIRYTTDTFFFMHTINCFELEGKLIIDVCAYKDAKLINALYTEAIKSFKDIPTFGEWMACRPKRIEIPLDSPNNTHVKLELISDVGIEFPRINYELCNGRPYRYFYGIGFEVNSTYSGSILKVDTRTGAVKTWNERYGNPSEPVFVSRPGSEVEDDGVVLSAVVWDDNEYAVTLLVLRASDLSELGRAKFTTPSLATKSFHGWFLPDKN